MSIKQNIIYSLKQSRGIVQGMVDAMSSRKDWLYQVHPKANHPLWVVGHIGLADNAFLKRLQPSQVDDRGWDDLFWFGSEISGDSDRYPETEIVLAYFHERRESLLKVIDGLNDEFLLSPSPDEGMFVDAPNMAAILIFTSFHEGMHAGQFTIAHRGLGHQPLFQPQRQTDTVDT
ncbi:MAG: DinB family protein [Planctomycetota bacterium]